ncbi:MAG TPA: hypothetical protein VFD73_03330, partial [Gemmatimonadales bacterium]|nr:hypothetical protein [Gemmatimonadales bacterium]
MRVLSRSKACCHSADAGRTNRERSRTARIQPPNNRSQQAIAPTSQAATTQGSSGSDNTRGTPLGNHAATLVPAGATVEAGPAKFMEPETGTEAAAFI